MATRLARDLGSAEGRVCDSGGVTDKRRVVFRGGIRGARDVGAPWMRRFGSFPWPLGTLTVDRSEVRISSPLGADAVAGRGDGSVVVLGRAGLFGMAMEIQRGGRMAPRFLPARPGRILSTLDRFGWPVRIDLPKPRRVHVRLLVVAALVLVALAVAEAVVNNNRADDMNARAQIVEGRIEAVKKFPRGGCCYSIVTFTVDGEPFDVSVTATNRQDTGDPVTIRYDPRDPSVAWADGESPPRTDDRFGLLGVILAIILLRAYRRRRDLQRYFASEDP